MTRNPSGGGSQVPADGVMQFGRVLTSDVSRGADGGMWVTFDVEGVGDLDLSDPANPIVDDSAGAGERTQQAQVFGALGSVDRPLAASGGRYAEALSVRTCDGLTPIALRDTRLAMDGNGPQAGTVGRAGYGGAFQTMQAVDPEDPDKGSIHTFYCPYSRPAGGEPTKAHVVVLDPTEGNESVTVVHADGMAVIMANGVLTLRSANGTASISLDGSDILLNGAVRVNGGFTADCMQGIELGVPFPVALVGALPGTPISGGPSTPA